MTEIIIGAIVVIAMFLSLILVITQQAAHIRRLQSLLAKERGYTTKMIWRYQRKLTSADEEIVALQRRKDAEK